MCVCVVLRSNYALSLALAKFKCFENWRRSILRVRERRTSESGQKSSCVLVEQNCALCSALCVCKRASHLNERTQANAHTHTHRANFSQFCVCDACYLSLSSLSLFLSFA